LADRIGKNREIAGVHYASDTAAGKYLAAQCFELLAKCPTFQRVLGAAQEEH
jgi:acid phosphatase (class A)